MKIYNIIQIPKGLSQEMECDCREEYYSGMTAGTEEQKAKLVSTAITENGTYVQEDGFSQVDVNVIKPDVYFPMNPRTVEADSKKGIFFPIFVTGCTIDPTNYTLKAVGDVVSNISELHGDNGTYYVDVDITANPTDKTRVGYIQGAFTDTDGVMHAVKPCIVSQKPGSENQDYNSGYTAGYDDGKQDLVANIQGDYFTIPEGTTKIRNYAFQNACFSAITIPSSVTSIGDFAFADNICLKEIVIPSSVQTVGGMVFSFCQNLTAVTFENSTITNIGTDMFDGCGALKEVKLPDALTSLPGGTFSYCSSLETITIPSGVTSIGNNCFHSCKSLKTIIIPASVTNIGRDCFSYISGLTYMRFEGTTPPELESFDGFNASLGSSGYTWPIYVPCEAVEEYRTAWPYYAHRISCPDLPKIAPVSVNEDTPETGNDDTSSSATDNIPK